MPAPKRKATLKRSWMRLWPSRPARWWVRAAMAVKTQHIRHNDTIRLKAVFASIDAAHPHMTKEA